MEHLPSGVLNLAEGTIDFGVNGLWCADGNSQEVVGKESLENAQERTRHDVAEEVTAKDDAGWGSGNGPTRDSTADQADEDGFGSGDERGQNINPAHEHFLQIRQPDPVRLVLPHGNVEAKHGDH